MTPLNPITSASSAQIAAITAQQLLPGWIRRRRKSLDLTQGDLAQRLSCSLSTIQKVEEGERRPSKNLATNLMEALEIPESERAVFMRLARGKPSPRNEPAVRGAPNLAFAESAAPPNNTPFPTNALIAREAETDWVCTLLAGDDARLVTLTGLPGVGKTRLAQHIAHLAQFGDGVCYVSLADLPAQQEAQTACAAVTQAIRSALQAGASPDAPLLDTANELIAHLREMHLLLVLDNFEHVQPARGLLIRLLQETRWVKLLITSRERLRLHAEHTVQLAGLPMSEELGEESPALQLFMARASRVSALYRAGPGFAEKGDLQKMLRICRLVDGLPLGIEMASELTVTHSLDEIGDAIERDLNALRTSAPDVPERHRNMRAVVASLWQKLSVEEQRVVAGCATVGGNFGFEELARALQPGSQPPTPSQPHTSPTGDGPNSHFAALHSLLDALIEKAWLRRVLGQASQAQCSRYQLHPLLQTFAVQAALRPGFQASNNA